MKVLLLYFTGTYNTLYITTLIKNIFLSKKIKVDTCLIKNGMQVSYTNYDVIGIGYPIHFHNAPKIVESYIKKSKIENKKFFVYKTFSKDSKNNEASSYKLVSLLTKKNNELLGEYSFLMPSTYGKRFDDQFVNYLMKYNVKYIKYMCENILDKKTYKVSLFRRFIRTVNKMFIKPFSINSSYFFVDKQKCYKCRQCINNCPNKNIEYNKKARKIVFKNKCLNCLRCIHCCPSNAIKTRCFKNKIVSERYNYLKIMSMDCEYTLSNKYVKYQSYFDYIDNTVK